MNVGIIGAGSIAAKVSRTLKKLNDENVALYAIASRETEKAESFRKKFSFEKAYGSYAELLSDEGVDLVYIATPHPFHYPIAKQAIEAGRNVMVEKPITTDREKFIKLTELAKEKGVFLCETFQTAFGPLLLELKREIAEGTYGKILSVKSSFGIPIANVGRLTDLNLGGGALLDLGVYCVLHSAIYSNERVVSVKARAEKYKTGVDKLTEAHIAFESYGADFKCSFTRIFKNDVIIDTEKAIIKLSAINVPNKIVIKDKATGKRAVRRIKEISGYEFHFIAALKYLAEGRLQSDEMPWSTSEKVLSV
ncbi:MAG: Gfo/Idh/MocA family oxidoreductase, partial [Clostridia bacterium]|nr:Gfo/Idh/MocA family oxidoreductase [Clostridia bacterium]